jgi:hypothetical protein
MSDDTDLELGSEMPIVMQYNGGRCDKCDGLLRESPYVGGDHDPIAECPNCGKHFGCWACKK